MSECRYFVPGPTWVRPEIAQEMTRPVVGHRSAAFRELYARIAPRLRTLFATSQNVFVASTSGTGMMEGALLNCVPRSVLVTTCGAFSERWLRIAQNLGLEADQLEFPWGSPADPTRLADHISGRRHHYDAVTITHNETSTGVMNDVRSLARAVRERSNDTLILVDAVSSLGGAPVLVDEWGVDVCLASTQKGLALPPGITVVAASDRAMEQAAKKPYRGLYFDFLEYRKHAEEGGVPFTPSVPHFYALARQLEEILEGETIEARWTRHVQMRDLTLERTAPFADLASDREHASPTISALRPKSVGARELVTRMKEHGFTLGGGYGAWREETFRIGHMGDIPLADLAAMLDVLEEVAR
jgi:aspartate aminotransferase-like enzyme